jgi:hypothetical protein
VVELRAGSFGGSGAPYVLPVYVAAGTSRWLRFTPWVGRYDQGFTLSWPDGRHQLDQPRSGRPATVAVGGSLPAPVGAVPVLPAELFPAASVAWAGLAQLALDHDPAWTAEQRAAAAAWVRGGGSLALFTGRDGRMPALSGALADLERDPGAGSVVPMTAGLGESRALLLPGMPSEAAEQGSGSGLVAAIQRTFGSVVQARHNWPVIGLILVVYVLALTLVPWWLGRRRRPWQLVYGVALMVIAGVTVALAIIGRRGYGESAITRAICVAEHLGGGQYAVTTLGSSFVVSSGTVTVAHGTGGDLYACPVEQERVEGLIVAGREARLTASVPLFTNHHWAHGAQRSGPQAPDLVHDDEGWLVTPPAGAAIERAWLAMPAGVLEFTPASNGFRVTNQERPMPFADLERERSFNAAEDGALVWRSVGGLALAWSLAPTSAKQPPARAPRPGRVAVFLLAAQPAAWQAPGLGTQEGRVLYRYDLPGSAP